MNQLIYLLVIPLVFLCNCDSKTGSKSESKAKLTPTFEELLSLYKSIDIDTFHVYSEPGEYENDKYRFKGIKLDSIYFSLFPIDIQESLFADNELYACYQFDIDKNTVGLITRTPSEYVPSSIKLLVFDKSKKKISTLFELSESWGDAGDSMIKDFWLIKNKAELKWAYLRQDCSYESDTILECEDSIAMISYDQGGINISPIDSLSFAVISKGK